MEYVLFGREGERNNILGKLYFKTTPLLWNNKSGIVSDSYSYYFCLACIFCAMYVYINFTLFLINFNFRRMSSLCPPPPSSVTPEPNFRTCSKYLYILFKCCGLFCFVGSLGSTWLSTSAGVWAILTTRNGYLTWRWLSYTGLLSENGVRIGNLPEEHDSFLNYHYSGGIFTAIQLCVWWSVASEVE